MKSFEQLAKSGYEAAAKQHQSIEAFALHHCSTYTPEPDWSKWAELDDAKKSCWIAAAKQVVSEIAAIH